MYIRGLIPRNYAELAKAVSINMHRLNYEINRGSHRIVHVLLNLINMSGKSN